MPVNAVSMDNIPETSYLNTDNTAHYRAIMRVFYDESEKTHYQLDKETVLGKLHQIPAFADYTMEQLLPHLNQLVIWKNLTPIQDPSRANTISEYKNNQFRYLMSGAAVEVERMTIRLETLVLESASLSIYLFPRIQNALMAMESLQTAPLKDVDEWWQNLQEDFKRLNQNYQDYLRDFYSSKAEHMMRSTEFIAHKEHVVKYLRDFVQELQSRGGKIEKVLFEIPNTLTNTILDKIVTSELDKPRPTSERPPNFEAQIKENIRGKWRSLYEWFVSEPSRLSESQYVLETTNEVIRKIIQNANFIIQMQNSGVSRKEDYKKFLRLFAECESLKEAHKLSAHVFGVASVRHFTVNSARDTDNINSSVYEEAPCVYVLDTRSRQYKPRIDKSGFASKSLEKTALRQKFLEEQERTKKLALQYIQNGKLDFSAITDTLEPSTRQIFLNWVVLANNASDRYAITEYGQKFHLLRQPGSCMLHCTDGNLTMPAYVLVFEGRDVNG